MRSVLIGKLPCCLENDACWRELIDSFGEIIGDWAQNEVWALFAMGKKIVLAAPLNLPNWPQLHLVEFANELLFKLAPVCHAFGALGFPLDLPQ